MLNAILSQQNFFGVVASGITVWLLAKVLEFVWTRTHPHLGKFRQQRMPMMWIFVVGGALTGWVVYAAIYGGLLRQTPDISWDFDTVTATHPLNFIGMTSREEDEGRVWGFQATGRNNLDDPIENAAAYVRSDATNTRYEVLANVGGTLHPFSATTGIPPHADFMVNSDPFPSDDPRYTGGIGARRFLMEVAPLTFVFEYNGRRYTRHFSKQEIKAVMDRFEQERQAARRANGPRVRLRSAQ